jgi:hypothetical protein
MEYFADMFGVILWVIRVDEDVVKVDDDTNVEHVVENIVDEALEGRGSVGKPERHYAPLKGSVSCAEGGFPFISVGDPDKVVRVPEIYFGVDARVAGTV